MVLFCVLQSQFLTHASRASPTRACRRAATPQQTAFANSKTETNKRERPKRVSEGILILSSPATVIALTWGGFLD